MLPGSLLENTAPPGKPGIGIPEACTISPCWARRPCAWDALVRKAATTATATGCEYMVGAPAETDAGPSEGPTRNEKARAPKEMGTGSNQLREGSLECVVAVEPRPRLAGIGSNAGGRSRFLLSRTSARSARSRRTT